MASPRFSFFFLLTLLVSCGPANRREPALGEAYVGPSSVNLRKDIPPKSPTVATVHFGDKVEIVSTKRRFVRVRIKAGSEGWIDQNMLLGQSDMDQIKAQSDAARAYPSQGVATTFETMNVHAQPNRYSASYIQLKEGERFDVLEHRLVAVPPSAVRKPLIPAAPKVAKRPKKENKSKVPPPPAPLPPPLPSDWRDLSKEGEDAVEPKIEEPPPVTPEEDWSMVRTASGQSGWVLSRRLYLAIPDEVAQYAEGHRITSYFMLGKVEDGERVKNVWLWTTINSSNHSYDFDGFRVFIWSLKRHRYETALIQRHLQGYFPTMVDAKSGTFGICVAKEDGQRYRRQYRLVESQVKFVDEKPCDTAAPEKATPPPGQKAPEGALDKLKGKLKSIMK
jgi:hypothetical protein